MKATESLAAYGILTRSELVERLNLTDETITRMEREDDFPCRRSGRVILYDIWAIRRWINTTNKTKKK